MPKIRDNISLTKLLPNVITLFGLAVGVGAIRFALEDRWEIAVASIVAAALIDGVDGRVARLLNSTSTFGAELDSLSDFVNFGLVPSVMVYIWLSPEGPFRLLVWFCCVIYIICMAIRLARFNTTNIDGTKSNLPNCFFVGVPAPSGALLILAPMMIDFDMADSLDFLCQNHPLFVILYIVIIGCLVASRVPTFSLKQVPIRADLIWAALLISSIAAIMLIIYPWYVLPIIGVIYIASFFVSAAISKRIN